MLVEAYSGGVGSRPEECLGGVGASCVGCIIDVDPLSSGVLDRDRLRDRLRDLDRLPDLDLQCKT